MKRSDMVGWLSVELDDIISENYYDEKGSMWCADLLLSRMEELGMAPPFFDKVQNNNRSTVIIPAREWEDE